eukprot:1560928-Prymnesium_polylepis.1
MSAWWVRAGQEAAGVKGGNEMERDGRWGRAIARACVGSDGGAPAWSASGRARPRPPWCR